MGQELLVLFGSFLIAVFIRIPIFLAVLIATVIYSLSFPHLSALSAGHSLISGLDRQVIAAIPYYFLLGAVLSAGGMALRLLKFARCLVGWCKGGLAQVNIGASMLFGGISGSAVADASAIGALIIPAMKDDGYSPAYASAVTATSASIGLLIPPSIPMVLFGIFNNVSVGSLFLAGLLPGILMGLILVTTSWLIAGRRGYGATDSFSVRLCVHAARDAFWVLLLPVMITLALVRGVATATEVGALAVFYSIVITLMVYRDVTPRKLLRVVAESAADSAKILSIIAASGALLWSVADLGIAKAMTQSLSELSISPSTLLIVLSGMLVLAGTIMGPGLLLILFVPSVTPVALSAGIDVLHFAVVAILSSSISLVTPPVGVLLFITAAQSEAEIVSVLREMIPYYVALTVLLILVIYFPELSTGLVNLMSSLPR